MCCCCWVVSIYVPDYDVVECMKDATPPNNFFFSSPAENLFFIVIYCEDPPERDRYFFQKLFCSRRRFNRAAWSFVTLSSVKRRFSIVLISLELFVARYSKYLTNTFLKYSKLLSYSYCSTGWWCYVSCALLLLSWLLTCPKIANSPLSLKISTVALSEPSSLI